jgi:glycosyltransferase involved in cell wall biosynthesis
VKVLLLHQHFNTPYEGGAVRSYYLAKSLVDHGIETVVITAAHYDTHYRKETIDGIEIHYLPIPYDNSFGFYKRSLSFVQYIWQAPRLAKKLGDVTICYAISVPLTVGIAARRISARHKIPFIFEVGDLWPEAPIQMGFIKNRLFQNVLYNLEKKIYAAAKSIVALSPAIASDVRRKAPGKTIHLIPNMSDTDFFKPAPKDAALVQKFNTAGKFVVSYIGAIGMANGLEHFVLCAKASADAGLPVHFFLCGEGAFLDRIKNKVRDSHLKNFSILPFQNREGVREILNVTDASFVSYRPVPVLETGSPNKYFDGLAAGKLIVVNFGGWIREEIESNGCGIFVKPDSPEDFVTKINPFLKDEILLRQHQQNARRLAEKKYSRQKLGSAFAAIFINNR